MLIFRGRDPVNADWQWNPQCRDYKLRAQPDLPAIPSGTAVASDDVCILRAGVQPTLDPYAEAFIAGPLPLMMLLIMVMLKLAAEVAATQAVAVTVTATTVDTEAAAVVSRATGTSEAVAPTVVSELVVVAMTTRTLVADTVDVAALVVAVVVAAAETLAAGRDVTATTEGSSPT